MDYFEEKRCQSSQKLVYVKVLITYAILDTQFFILLRLSSEISSPEVGDGDVLTFFKHILTHREFRRLEERESGRGGGAPKSRKKPEKKFENTKKKVFPKIICIDPR